MSSEILAKAIILVKEMAKAPGQVKIKLKLRQYCYNDPQLWKITQNFQFLL